MGISIVAPRLTLVGAGSVRELPDLLGKLGLSRPLVVSDPFLVSSGMIGNVLDPLAASGIAAAVFSDTVPEPIDTVIDTGLAVLRAGTFDCLVAFGGGSPIDTAKAMSVLASGGAHIREWKVPVAADRGALPVIAIPTTAGTGSEASRATVITDTTSNEKMLIMGLGALPVAAILDYELTFSVPPRVTADTGLDSLTHALEAYVSRRANAFSDALALSAMALIGRHLRQAYSEPRNASAREGMMLGANQAGMAFTNSSVALVHGMSRPVGAHFHVPHGLSNAMLLPAVTGFSLQAALPRYAEAARRIGFAGSDEADAVAAERLAAGLASLNQMLAVPSPQQYGIPREAWDARIELMADQAIASGSPANNPRVPEKAEIVALYQAVWAGSNA